MAARDKGCPKPEDMPLPFRLVSEADGRPFPQTPAQRLAERRTGELAAALGPGLGLTRREFLKTACGLAAAFLALNTVHGPLFAASPKEASDPQVAAERQRNLAGQVIFDVQTHFVWEGYPSRRLLGLRRQAAAWNPDLRGVEPTLEQLHFENYVHEVFLRSDTRLALLSSAPSDDPRRWFVHNGEIARAREVINGMAGSKRLYSHAVFTPGRPGWLEDLERAISEYRPDSWKGYTIGAPLSPSRWPWRLDDEKLVYPAYEKMLKAGIVNVCIHKGLLPRNYERRLPATWRYGMVGDVGQAARDWPQLNFVIYHSAIRYGAPPGPAEVAAFEKEGRIPWVSELARIPARHGVSNVYCDLGSVFAVSAVSQPRYCAGILGTLVKGLGQTRVLWGTDAVWYGSPQWQIEALRRLEIPEDLQRRFGFAPLGQAGGEVKNLIFAGNAARLYGLDLPEAARRADMLSHRKGWARGMAERLASRARPGPA